MDNKYNQLINNAETKAKGIGIKVEQLAKGIEDFVIEQMKEHNKTFINPGKCRKFDYWEGHTEYKLNGIRFNYERITIEFSYMYCNDISRRHIVISQLPYNIQVSFLKWFINEVVIPENFTIYS